VKEKKRTRRKTAINDENTLVAVQLNPTISIRQLEKECELSRRSILRILHEKQITSISHSLASKFRKT